MYLQQTDNRWVQSLVPSVNWQCLYLLVESDGDLLLCDTESYYNAHVFFDPRYYIEFDLLIDTHCRFFHISACEILNSCFENILHPSIMF